MSIPVTTSTTTITTTKFRRIFGITFKRSTTYVIDLNPKSLVSTTDALLKSSAL